MKLLNTLIIAIMLSGTPAFAETDHTRYYEVVEILEVNYEKMKSSSKHTLGSKISRSKILSGQSTFECRVTVKEYNQLREQLLSYQEIHALEDKLSPELDSLAVC